MEYLSTSSLHAVCPFLASPCHVHSLPLARAPHSLLPCSTVGRLNAAFGEQHCSNNRGAPACWLPVSNVVCHSASRAQRPHPHASQDTALKASVTAVHALAAFFAPSSTYYQQRATRQGWNETQRGGAAVADKGKWQQVVDEAAAALAASTDNRVWSLSVRDMTRLATATSKLAKSFKGTGRLNGGAGATSISKLLIAVSQYALHAPVFQGADPTAWCVLLHGLVSASQTLPGSASLHAQLHPLLEKAAQHMPGPLDRMAWSPSHNQSLRPQTLVSLMWVYAVLGYKQGDNDVALDHVIRGVLQSMRWGAMRTAQARHWAVLLWSLAKVGATAAEVETVLENIGAEMAIYSPMAQGMCNAQDVSNTLWAVAEGGYVSMHGPALHAAAQALKARNVFLDGLAATQSLQAASNSVWAVQQMLSTSSRSSESSSSSSSSSSKSSSSSDTSSSISSSSRHKQQHATAEMQELGMQVASCCIAALKHHLLGHYTSVAAAVEHSTKQSGPQTPAHGLEVPSPFSEESDPGATPSSSIGVAATPLSPSPSSTLQQLHTTTHNKTQQHTTTAAAAAASGTIKHAHTDGLTRSSTAVGKGPLPQPGWRNSVCMAVCALASMAYYDEELFSLGVWVMLEEGRARQLQGQQQRAQQYHQRRYNQRDLRTDVAATLWACARVGHGLHVHSLDGLHAHTSDGLPTVTAEVGGQVRGFLGSKTTQHHSFQVRCKHGISQQHEAFTSPCIDDQGTLTGADTTTGNRAYNCKAQAEGALPITTAHGNLLRGRLHRDLLELMLLSSQGSVAARAADWHGPAWERGGLHMCGLSVAEGVLQQSRGGEATLDAPAGTDAGTLASRAKQATSLVHAHDDDESGEGHNAGSTGAMGAKDAKAALKWNSATGSYCQSVAANTSSARSIALPLFALAVLCPVLLAEQCKQVLPHGARAQQHRGVAGEEAYEAGPRSCNEQSKHQAVKGEGDAVSSATSHASSPLQLTTLALFRAAAAHSPAHFNDHGLNQLQMAFMEVTEAGLLSHEQLRQAGWLLLPAAPLTQARGSALHPAESELGATGYNTTVGAAAVADAVDNCPCVGSPTLTGLPYELCPVAAAAARAWQDSQGSEVEFQYAEWRGGLTRSSRGDLTEDDGRQEADTGPAGLAPNKGQQQVANEAGGSTPDRDHEHLEAESGGSLLGRAQQEVDAWLGGLAPDRCQQEYDTGLDGLPSGKSQKEQPWRLFVSRSQQQVSEVLQHIGCQGIQVEGPTHDHAMRVDVMLPSVRPLLLRSYLTGRGGSITGPSVTVSISSKPSTQTTANISSQEFIQTISSQESKQVSASNIITSSQDSKQVAVSNVPFGSQDYKQATTRSSNRSPEHEADSTQNLQADLSSSESPSFGPVAIEFNGPDHYLAVPAQTPSGSTMLRRRQLQRRAHCVVSVPWWEWASLELDDEAKGRYLAQLLLEAI